MSGAIAKEQEESDVNGKGQGGSDANDVSPQGSDAHDKEQGEFNAKARLRRRNERFKRKMTPIEVEYIPPTPTTTNFKPFMIILVGIPGSGKSTFARLLTKAMPYKFERVNQDELKTRQECVKMATQALEQRKCVIVDRCNFDMRQRQTWYDLAKSFGVSIHCVILNFPVELCIKRCQFRGQHETIKAEEAAKVVNRVKKEMKLPNRKEKRTFSFHLTIEGYKAFNNTVIQYVNGTLEATNSSAKEQEGSDSKARHKPKDKPKQSLLEVEYIPPSPTTTNFRPFMIILVGIPGSGKSTFARLLTKAMPYKFERVNQDELKTRQECVKMATQALEQRKCVIVDRCNFDMRQRQTWYDLAKSFDVAVHCVVLRFPPNVCIKRCQSRGQHETIKAEEAAKVVNIVKKQMKLPDGGETKKLSSHLTIHNTNTFNDAVIRYLNITKN
eukprot:scaffold1734_cov196-Cylindrotheca_fusiformis.AAC.8